MFNFTRHLALATTLAATALASSSPAMAAENSRTPAQERAMASTRSGDLQTQAKPGRPKVWAAVVSDTALVTRGAATGASNLSAGSFQVDFPVDVSNCVYVANQGTTDAGSQPDGTATTARRVGVPTAVFVKTYDSTGASANRSFHLAAICP